MTFEHIFIFKDYNWYQGHASESVCSIRLTIPSANAILGPNDGTMLSHRLRRWTNIVPTLDEHLMFAGSYYLRKEGYGFDSDGMSVHRITWQVMNYFFTRGVSRAKAQRLGFGDDQDNDPDLVSGSDLDHNDSPDVFTIGVSLANRLSIIFWGRYSLRSESSTGRTITKFGGACSLWLTYCPFSLYGLGFWRWSIKMRWSF